MRARGPLPVLPTLLALATAACAGSAPVDVAAVSHPSQLVGLWVAEGATIPPGTVLKFKADEHLFLFSACGAPFGRWRAVPGGAFSAILTVAAPDCPPIPGPDEWERNTPVWLRSVVTFRPDGSSRVLLDGSGRTVATLRATATAPGELLLGEQGPPDPPSPTELARLDGVPSPHRRPGAAHPADLTGRWIVADPALRRPDAYVRFGADGTLKVRDGCNSARGRWTLTHGGSFAAVLSRSDVVACDNVKFADWLQLADWATRDGDRLVFTGADDHELGALIRSD